jgi:spore germination protein
MQRLNAFLRVPEISGRLRLAVVRGDFESFLQSQINRQEGIDVYLYKMFKHYERQGDMAIVNAHLFLESYYSPYSDPILPMFTVEQNQLVYAGSALFQNDRLVKTIPVEDDHLFQTIACARRFHSHIPLPEHNIVLGKMFSTRQIRFADRYHEGVVTVRLRGRVEEYTGDKDLSDPEQAASLTRELEQHLEERLRKQIREFQKLSIDPMQFGLRTLNLFRQPFSGSEWKRRWLELPVTVRVELALDNFGSVKVKPKNRDRVNVSDSREELP